MSTKGRNRLPEGPALGSALTTRSPVDATLSLAGKRSGGRNTGAGARAPHGHLRYPVLATGMGHSACPHRMPTERLRAERRSRFPSPTIPTNPADATADPAIPYPSGPAYAHDVFRLQGVNELHLVASVPTFSLLRHGQADYRTHLQAGVLFLHSLNKCSTRLKVLV
jgi:hypothetical protein